MTEREELATEQVSSALASVLEQTGGGMVTAFVAFVDFIDGESGERRWLVLRPPEQFLDVSYSLANMLEAWFHEMRASFIRATIDGEDDE